MFGDWEIGEQIGDSQGLRLGIGAETGLRLGIVNPPSRASANVPCDPHCAQLTAAGALCEGDFFYKYLGYAVTHFFRPRLRGYAGVGGGLARNALDSKNTSHAP